MLRNLASSLFLTERDAQYDKNKPRVTGRVVTTLQKAKEVRSLVEKCITLARRSLPHAENAKQYATRAKRGSEEWREWRSSDRWRQWCQARAPVVAARRRALRLLGDRQAVRILFEEIAPRFAQREGGYTRVLKLARPRLGDAGRRAILELVGVRDRTSMRSQKPAFTDQEGQPAPEPRTLPAAEPPAPAEAQPAPDAPPPASDEPQASS